MKRSLDSTYRVGLAYEKLTLEVLKRHIFHLKHTGCSGDGGQDFAGYWLLPNRAVPIVGQCKCWRRPVGPKEVREFESVLFRECPQNSDLHVGVMVSRSWYSAGALKTFQSSQMAMIFMQIIKSSQWNTRLENVSQEQDFQPRFEPNMSQEQSFQPSTARLEPNTVQTNSCRSGTDWCPGMTGDTGTMEAFPHKNSTRIRTQKSLRKAEVGCTDNGTEDLRSDGDLDGNAEEVGYVTDIALNKAAKKELGDVQVLWKWRTVGGRPQRRLELIA